MITHRDRLNLTGCTLPIVQCIGVAYTFNSSLQSRSHRASARLSRDSSSPFSYFYKGDARSIRGHRDNLLLSCSEEQSHTIIHLPEAELAAVLGNRHRIHGYCLANDFTAVTYEKDSSRKIDSTFAAKVWDGSGSLGPMMVTANNLPPYDTLTIKLQIQRGSSFLFEYEYSLASRVREFKSIPDAIVQYYESYTKSIPLSKKIKLDSDGYLPKGTVIMLGTGIIVDSDVRCQVGDVVTIECGPIGTLENVVATFR